MVALYFTLTSKKEPLHGQVSKVFDSCMDACAAHDKSQVISETAGPDLNRRLTARILWGKQREW